MHEEIKKPELSEICQIEKDLISALKTAVSHGVFSKEVDGKELGELVDMVKDMAEAKRNCWEAYYYETVSKAMEEYDPYEDSMGYKPNRYLNGRYAPTVNKTFGYRPYFDKMPIPMRPGTVFHDEGLMGYDNGQNGNRRNGNRNQSYGYPYDMTFEEYENAKRHYTESKSLEDKDYMDEKALEHMNHSMMCLREIWKDSDPKVKKEVSTAVSSLASEFKSI